MVRKTSYFKYERKVSYRSHQNKITPKGAHTEKNVIKFLDENDLPFPEIATNKQLLSLISESNIDRLGRQFSNHAWSHRSEINALLLYSTDLDPAKTQKTK